MAVQLIIYSKATGRVRRVIDPNAAVANAIQFIAQGKAGPNEGTLLYTKQVTNDLNAWQAAVTAATSKVPASDRYCIIDANNNIVGAILADPLCGDAVPNCTLVQHDIADQTWVFTPPSTFVPPATLPKPVP